MKRQLTRIIFLLLISFGIQVVLHELWFAFFHKETPNIIISNKGEYFDPSFMRLSSISAFINYCDSINGGAQIDASDSESYATTIATTLRGRFFHSYSYYGLGQNFMAHVFAPFVKKDLSAIVIPDDILKHPNAACSQQSIVGMEIFKRKGFNVRKLTFSDKKYGGHFCFEAFYNGKWHYFDPDMEPQLQIMVILHHPGIEELNKNDSLLYALYSTKEKGYVKSLFSNYSYGKVNTFPAKRARIYQYITKYLSYTLWFWLILLYFFVRNRFLYTKKKNKCVELQDSLAPAAKA